MKMSINRASMIFRFASWVILVVIGCKNPSMRYWPPLEAKSIVTCFLPHPENEHQWRINISWSCIFADRNVTMWQFFIYEVIRTFLIKTVYDRYVNPWWNWGSISVSKGYSFLVQIQVRIQPGMSPWYWVLPHEFLDSCNWAGFNTENPSLEPHNSGRNEVFVFWLHCNMMNTYIVQF